MESLLAFALIVALVLVVVLVALVQRVTVGPGEKGILLRGGTFREMLEPGTYTLTRFSTVKVISELPQEQTVPVQNAETRDGRLVNGEVFFRYRVVDVKKAFFEINNHRVAVTALTQVTARSIIGDTDAGDILLDRRQVEKNMLQMVAEAVEPWGVQMMALELRGLRLSEPEQGRAIVRKHDIGRKIRDALDIEVLGLGIKVEAVEIGEG